MPPEAEEQLRLSISVGAHHAILVSTDIVAPRSHGNEPALALRTDDGRHTWSLEGQGEPTEIHGSLGDVAAYLAGRSGADLTSPCGAVPTFRLGSDRVLPELRRALPSTALMSRRSGGIGGLTRKRP